LWGITLENKNIDNVEIQGDSIDPETLNVSDTASDFIVIEKEAKKTSAYIFNTSYCTVTERQFKTKRRTYLISKIEKTEIRRNFIVFFPIFILCLLFAQKFWDYLYVHEIVILGIVSVIGGYCSFAFGTLYVQSKALCEPSLLHRVSNLKKIRFAIDDAMLKIEELREENGFVNN
jgi:hypothetical protein